MTEKKEPEKVEKHVTKSAPAVESVPVKDEEVSGGGDAVASPAEDSKVVETTTEEVANVRSVPDQIKLGTHMSVGADGMLYQTSQVWTNLE